MHVFFDLDGTLTDPKVGIVTSIAHALRAMGREVESVEGFEQFIGPPLVDSFATLLGTTDQAQLDRAVGFYRERFATRGIYENELLPRIPELLETLRAQGHRLRVVTSKPQHFASIVIRHFELDPHFEAVHGATMDGRLHHKDELIAHVLENAGIDASESVMIGDREHDVYGAKANGVHAVAVRWGYGSEQELCDCGPNAIVGTTDELVAHLAGIGADEGVE